MALNHCSFSSELCPPGCPVEDPRNIGSICPQNCKATMLMYVNTSSRSLQMTVFFCIWEKAYEPRHFVVGSQTERKIQRQILNSLSGENCACSCPEEEPEVTQTNSSLGKSSVIFHDFSTSFFSKFQNNFFFATILQYVGGNVPNIFNKDSD
ncbi:hypothetical protein Y1Q_0004078 [Alligator mississippiensis]|uniref:Uncharacterized protein n=1 Tax=Alligator mississippiensis TaxID=8496 RepID=A0A151PHU3_ALLMI|nr:hypothetical protein Y1Q_0004078 [Alligator mississippiensis]